jgi:multidrug efflux system membrane fusion protein
MIRTARMLLVGLGLFLGSCLAFAGCSNAPPEGAGKNPPTVTVSYPLQREVTDYQDYTGRTAAVDSVQIQARVTGYLEKIYFTEGAEVEEGTVLYEIDPRPYKATWDAAVAQVALDKASLELAKQNNKRFQQLAKDQTGAVTQVDLDKYQSLEDQAIAALNKSRADLDNAKLNLDWTKVKAPVTGVVGRLLVTRGNLIVANQTTLTTLVAQDPMWVYFDMDEPTALQVRELIRQGKFVPKNEGVTKLRFRLQLANDKGFPHEALFDFVNNQLDQGTATILIRGIFHNPKPATGPRLFTPNLFVRVRVPTSSAYQALLVNAEAVGTDQDLKYLLAVDHDNKVVRHAVKLGSLQDGLQVISEGLEPGERVIVRAMQRVHPDDIVNPKLVPMPLPGQDSQAPAAPPVLKNPAPAPKK